MTSLLIKMAWVFCSVLLKMRMSYVLHIDLLPFKLILQNEQCSKKYTTESTMTTDKYNESWWLQVTFHYNTLSNSLEGLLIFSIVIKYYIFVCLLTSELSPLADSVVAFSTLSELCPAADCRATFALLAGTFDNLPLACKNLTSSLAITALWLRFSSLFFFSSCHQYVYIKINNAR